MFDRDLKPLGILQPIVLPETPDLLAQAFPDNALAGVKLYDENIDPRSKKPAPRWIGVCLSSFGIVYNSDVYGSLGLPAPSRWHDLAEPRLSGWVALADPTHSGSAAVAYMMVLQRAMADAEEAYHAAHPGLLNKTAPEYQSAIAAGWHRGMGQLLLIAANARYFTDSSTQPPNDVGNGDAAAGVAIDFYGRTFEHEIGSRRIHFLAPRAATAVTPDAVAILYGVKGDRQVLARHFVQFNSPRAANCCGSSSRASPAAQSARLHRPDPPRPVRLRRRPQWVGRRRQPLRRIRRLQPAPGNGWRCSATCAPSGPPLGSTPATPCICLRQGLAVSDDARRSALLAELADLPITLAQVAALRDRRKQLEASGADETWKAEQRQAWARTFRDHYAKVEGEARK